MATVYLKVEPRKIRYALNEGKVVKFDTPENNKFTYNGSTFETVLKFNLEEESIVKGKYQNRSLYRVSALLWASLSLMLVFHPIYMAQLYS